MTIAYNTTVKNDRLLVVANAIDAGAPSAGKIQIFDFAEANLLVEVPFESPCYSLIANGVLTFDVPVIEPITSISGTAAVAKLVTSAGIVVADGLTVGTSAGYDVQLNSTTLTAGEPCKIISANITHG